MEGTLGNFRPHVPELWVAPQQGSWIHSHLPGSGWLGLPPEIRFRGFYPLYGQSVFQKPVRQNTVNVGEVSTKMAPRATQGCGIPSIHTGPSHLTPLKPSLCSGQMSDRCAWHIEHTTEYGLEEAETTGCFSLNFRSLEIARQISCENLGNMHAVLPHCHMSM